MKVQDLISEIESQWDYPTWMSMSIVGWELMEWYFRDEDWQFWQIRKVSMKELGDDIYGKGISEYL